MDSIFPPAIQAYVPLIKNIGIAIGIFIVGWMLSKWAARMTHKTLEGKGVDLALARFLGQLARYAVLAATIITALGTVGIQTTSFLAVFASAGLAVGLALQGNLAHFASGVMILFFSAVFVG